MIRALLILLLVACADAHAVPLPDPPVVLCVVDLDGQVATCGDTLLLLDTIHVWGDTNPHLTVGSGPGHMVAGFHTAVGTFEAVINTTYTGRGPGGLPFVFVIQHADTIMSDGAEDPDVTWGEM